MIRNLLLTTVLMLIFTSCDRVVNKAKSTINKGGEAVGGTATEFFDGVSKGVDKTLECKLVLSEDLQQKGLQTGAFSIENEEGKGENNVLVLYLIYNKDFKSELIVKAYNTKGLEVGRSELLVKGKSGEASYVDFKFNPRTYIGNRYKITLERK